MYIHGIVQFLIFTLVSYPFKLVTRELEGVLWGRFTS